MVIFFVLMAFLAIPEGFFMGPRHWTRWVINLLSIGFSATSFAGALLTIPTMGCCCVQAMPTRAALARLWLVVRIFFSYFSMMLTGVFILLVVEPEGPAEGGSGAPIPLEGVYLLSQLFVVLGALSSGICASVLRPSFRRWVHRRLGDLAMQGESRSAAAIAALVGGRDSTAALQHGATSFRGLPFAKLEEDDLKASTSTVGLYERTRPATLGTVAAFVSHSWHDGPDAKWAALTKWASEQASPPLLWLDKV